jgi:hypothetical protein
MARWFLAGLLALVLPNSICSAGGAQPALVPGGLTALPSTTRGANLVQNGDFETLNTGLPTGWTGGAGWSADQLVAHSGAVSYQRVTGAPNSSQRLQLRAGTYLLSGWVKADNLGSGTSSGVRLMLDFRAGGINAWTTSEVISGTSDWQLYQVGPIVVDTDRIADVRLENFGGAVGTAWFDDIRLEQVLPQSVDAFLLYPNYRGMLFDDQPQTIQLDVKVTPPGDFSAYTVKAVLSEESSGQVVAQQSFAAAPHLVATLDGAVMQPGIGYLASVSLVELTTQTVVGTYPAYRVSKVAASTRQSMNVAFDARNRILLKGVPRFVLGVYDAGLGYSETPSFWETTLWSPTGARRMSGLKINMYLNYHYGEASAAAMAALMTNLQAHGVMYLQTGNCYDRLPADPEFQINASDAYVQSFGAQQGSAGYYTVDECRASLQPGAFAQYLRLRQLDPDSMTLATLFAEPELSLWRDSADVLSTDPYPLFGAEPAGGYPLALVADWTAQSRAAVQDARPIMTVLQFFKFTAQGRFPTLAEMRSMAYMAIVEGARGLWWWSLGTNALRDVCPDWCPARTAYMGNLKSVVNELAAIERVLLADDASGALATNSNASAIRTRAKIVGGKGYLLAYNYTGAQQTASFTWSTAPGTISVNTENRALTAAGSTFTDTFAPYQAHVYVIYGGTGSPLTAAITAPTAGATVYGSVPIAASASGGAGSGYAYTIAVDGVTLATGSSPSVAWDTRTVVDGPHTLTVTVTDADGETQTASQAVTVLNTPPSIALTFNGKTRDRVGQGNAALSPDGAMDGVLTATFTGATRTVARLRLDSSGPGTWDTDPATESWALGVAASADDALVNDRSTAAVSFSIGDGGSFALFASDYANLEFTPGATLTLTVTFADGTTATTTTTVAAAPAPPPAQGVTLALAYNGKTQDRVGQGNTALSPDGAPDGAVTVTLTAAGGRTIAGLRLESSAPGTWDTDATTPSWALGVARTASDPLLNDPSTMRVNFAVPDGGTLLAFAADYNNIEFVPGTTLTLTATFSDGTTATASTTVANTPPPPPPPPPGPSGATLAAVYNGKVRDRVGQGATALGPDGAPDGTLTVTLTASGGRTVSGVRLDSTGPGQWDTDPSTVSWALGVAASLDGPLLNAANTAVNFTVADGGSFALFASDYANIEFAPGATLTVRVTFSDGTSATTSTTVGTPPPAPPPASGVVSIAYNGKLEDRVGHGAGALSADGAADGTVTVTMLAAGGRTITGLRLESSGPGTWDTDGSTQYWALGVAASAGGPLLNDPTTAVRFTVPEGGTFLIFASDYANIEFASGATLTLTATLDDGTTARAVTTVP